MSEFDKNNAQGVPVSAIEKEMQSSFLDYAMSVIVERALPDVRDGCKPVHRRILFVMNEVAKSNVKCARIVGDVMGKYHPHGDSSIYEALVRMAQDFSMSEMLVAGQGNFGSMDGDGAAAMRYTEAKLAKISNQLMDDLDKETVNYRPNFDDSLLEPEVLPAKFPNFLVNGSNGIAVGMATNVPPYNLTEVCDGLLAVLDNPEIEEDELFLKIPGPDFPTGGIIMGRAGAYKAHSTGKGSVMLRARTEIEDYKDHQAIIITEIPYQVNKSQLVIKIAELAKEKAIEGISDLRDESSRDGVRVVIELKRDAVAEVVQNQLFDMTQMQVSFPVNMMAINHGRPALFSVKKVLEAFIDFRFDVIRRRTIFELNKSRSKAHTLLGLSVAVGNLDEIIALIKGSDTPDAAKAGLMGRGWKASDIADYIQLIADPNTDFRDGLFYMSEEQAKAILELRLHKLTGLEREKIHGDLTNLGEEIRRLLDILGNKDKIKEIIRNETAHIMTQFARPRRTEISDQECDIDIEDLIAKEDMVVTVSSTGYIKRVAAATYRAQKRGGKGRNAMTTKDEDFVSNMFVANTHTPLMFFSDRGIVYRMKTYKLPVGAAAGKGKPLVNLLPLTAGETITTILPVPEDMGDKSLMFITSGGNVRRNKAEAFENIRASGKIAMKLESGESLVDVLICDEKTQDIFISTKLGRCIRFNVDEIRVFAGRSSEGVRGVKLGAGDKVISAAVIARQDYSAEERTAYIKQSRMERRDEEIPEENDETAAEIQLSPEKYAEMKAAEQFILTVSQNGFGKRSSGYEYRTTHRGVGGYAAIKLGGKNTAVAASFPVGHEMDIMMVSDGGKIIRIPADSIRIAGRASQGVTLFKTESGEKIVSAIATDAAEEETIEGENDGTEKEIETTDNQQ
ncbi:MAG: DNA gyrase subunit A [Rickettsiales bacterium]|jgi:DNA gyrase subunit A|nr:DNA gyrase subunit A [Rickettsiales bacterium]